MPDWLAAPRLHHATRLAVAGALACGLITVNLAKLASFEVSDFDLGIYSNLAWNIAHGGGFHSGVLGIDHLGEHFSPVMAAIAPWYRVFPTAAVLLIAQVLAVIAAMLVLWPLLERILAPLPHARVLSTALVSACLLYAPLRSGLLADFHPSVLGVPLLAGALLCLQRGADRGLWICVAALLTTKELAIASTLGLALYAGLVVGRRRLAWSLAAVAVIAAGLVFLWIMPAHRNGSWHHLSRLAPFEDLLGKGVYLARLLFPLALLPLWGWRALLAAIPTTGLNLMVGYESQYSIRNHYDDQNAVFWIAAAAHGLAAVGARTRNWQFRTGPAAAAGALTAGLGIWLAGDALRGWGLASSWPDDRDRELRARLTRYAALPDDVPISAQSELGPYLNLRGQYRSLNERVLDHAPFLNGELIVISAHTRSSRLRRDPARDRLDADPRARRVENDALLDVWRWHADQAAGAAPIPPKPRSRNQRRNR